MKVLLWLWQSYAGLSGLCYSSLTFGADHQKPKKGSPFLEVPGHHRPTLSTSCLEAHSGKTLPTTQELFRQYPHLEFEEIETLRTLMKERPQENIETLLKLATAEEDTQPRCVPIPQKSTPRRRSINLALPGSPGESPRSLQAGSPIHSTSPRLRMEALMAKRSAVEKRADVTKAAVLLIAKEDLDK